jgi:hypothetical protein
MRADRKLDKAHDMKIFKALSDLDGEIPADYDAYLCHGAPFLPQLVGGRLEEEVLEMVEAQLLRKKNDICWSSEFHNSI